MLYSFEEILACIDDRYIKNAIFAEERLKSHKGYYNLIVRLCHSKYHANTSKIILARVFDDHLEMAASKRIVDSRDDDLRAILYDEVEKAVNFPQFGCCHNYVNCSNVLKCVHDDLIYATACMYRKNLENGKVFYGKNRNV